MMTNKQCNKIPKYNRRRFKAAVVTSACEAITPVRAKAMLKQNSSNFRLLNLDRAEFYKSLMTDGRWFPGVAVVSFGTVKGKPDILQNGQKVLHAIVESNTTQYLIVVRNLPEGAIAAVDSGEHRTPAQLLTHHGYNFAADRASTIKRLQSWAQCRKFWDSSLYMSADQVLDRAKATDKKLEMTDALVKASNFQRQATGLLTRKANLAVVHYILVTEARQPGLVNEFFDDVSLANENGTGVLELRTWLRERQQRRRERNIRTSNPEEIAAWFMTWNRYVKGTVAVSLDLLNNDEFPQPV